MTDDKIHAAELIVDTMTVETVEAKSATGITTGGGAVLTDGVVQTRGGQFVGRDAEEDNRSQVVSFISPDNALLWTKITELVKSLDDLPNRVGKLEVIYKPATDFEMLIIRLLLSVAAAIGISIGVAAWAWRSSRKRHWWQ